MKKILPIILAGLLFAACSPAVDNANPTRATSAETSADIAANVTANVTATSAETSAVTTATTTSPKTALITEPVTATDPAPIAPFADMEFTENDMAASNASIGGYVAYDDDYIYYANIKDGGLYKKGFDEQGAGEKLADGGSEIRSICVYGDSVFYVTDSEGIFNVYSVPKDGGDSRGIMPKVGYYFYIADDVCVYQTGDNSLVAEHFQTGERFVLDSHVNEIIFSDGVIYYSDNLEILGYNLKTGETPDDIFGYYGVTGMVKKGGKLVYRITAMLAGDEAFTEIIAVDLQTRDEDFVYSAHTLPYTEEYERYLDEQTYVPGSFNFNIDGMLYFAVLSDYKEDGFHTRTIYRRDLETKQTQDILTENSETPFYTYSPSGGFYSTPHGIYYYSGDGELVKL